MSLEPMVTLGRPESTAPPTPRWRPGDALVDIRVVVPISIVVPTYRERDNLPQLVARLAALRDKENLTLELLFMDDDSNDGSGEWVAEHAPGWVRLINRRERTRGLSPAVVDGLREATHPVVVVMDADLSHPPEKIPELILALSAEQQMVIGSRYVPGGSTDDDWGLLRWLNSRIATLMARPLTDVSDPMAGFFALRKSDLPPIEKLNPIGYKIGLEIIVRGRLDNVAEVPINFVDRVAGESKLSLKEQLRYIQHLRRLYMARFGMLTDIAQFGAVGASGLVVNLVVVTLLLMVGTADMLAVAGGIVVSVLSNFLLNRRFTFSYARQGSARKQLTGFAAASAVGAAIQFSVVYAMRRAVPAMPVQVAVLFGVAAGMGFNFLANRFVVFKKASYTRKHAA